MNSSLLAVLIVLAGSSLVMSASLQASGFRPGKAFHPSHTRAALSPSHHHSLMDLEKVKHAKKAGANAEASFEEKQDQEVDALLQKAATHMHQLEADFQSVKDDVAALKSTEEARHNKHSAKAAKPASAVAAVVAAAPVAAEAKPAVAKAQETAETAAKTEDDDFAAADDDNTASFLQFDDMNSGMVEDDDEYLAPPVPMAKRASNFVLQDTTGGSKDQKITFGLSGTQPLGTYDLTDDGIPVVHPSIEQGIEKITNNTVVPDMETDLTCVCKRQGAPKGHDRVKCKKHITPTPTPTPTPPPITGIRQCVNGTWSSDLGANVTDVICIYYPSQLPQLELNPRPHNPEDPSSAPDSPSVPEYPPECYDERNEFVAEGVVDKRKFDVLLLQEGFQTCDC